MTIKVTDNQYGRLS